MLIPKVELVLPDLGYPAIEVVTSAGTVDLHNFADFLGFEYLVTGELQLRWKLEDEMSRLAERQVLYATLHFGGVSELSVSPRDPDVPVSEDASLGFFYLAKRDGDLMWFVFEFDGGTKIEVTATSVALTGETR